MHATVLNRNRKQVVRYGSRKSTVERRKKGKGDEEEEKRNTVGIYISDRVRTYVPGYCSTSTNVGETTSLPIHSGVSEVRDSPNNGDVD